MTDLTQNPDGTYTLPDGSKLTIALQITPPAPVPPAPAVAAFSAKVDGLKVTFTDESTGARSVQFDPGNGGTPKSCTVGGNVIWDYAKSGRYTIIWMATGADGKMSKKWGTVAVGTPPVSPPPSSPTPPAENPPTPPVSTPPPAEATAIAQPHAVSQGTAAQTNVPVTFGQIFKAGDVPKGASLVATVDGQPVALQADAKATHADGSLRHAVLTALLPALAAGASVPLAIALGEAQPSGVPLPLSQLLATTYDAIASLAIGSVTYVASARALLQAGVATAWLSGPLASEWIVTGPLKATDGTAQPQLTATFAVRLYSGGQIRTDTIIENTNAYGPQAKPVYTATLTSGSASYTSPALAQHSSTRWHKVLWWNGVEPQVYLQQDTQYIQSSHAVSRYMQLTPDDKFLSGVRQSCDPLNHGDQAATMGDDGAQEGIGPLPRWTSMYIVDPDVRAFNWMLANTDALGAYSTHRRDAATGCPVSIQQHPYVTVADLSYAREAAKGNPKFAADLLPGGTGNPLQWDNAHQPSAAFVPYMVTGDWYFMEEVAFSGSQNNIWSNEGYRGYDKGLIDQSHSQVRGKAWTLRELADAAYLLPDSYPLKAEFAACVANSLADWNAKYTNNPSANPLGVMHDGPVYNMHGGTNNGIAPWQHNFLTWSAAHAADLGFAGAAEFRDWLAKFEIGLMTNWQTTPGGYCWLEASAYAIQVKDASAKWLPDFAAVYAATFPTLVGLTCNTPAMVAAMAKLKGNPDPGQVGEMYGYAYSCTGYPSNLQIGLAAAADTGSPAAHAAWTLFDSRSVKPSGDLAYNNYPNFALLPREAA